MNPGGLSSQKDGISLLMPAVRRKLAQSVLVGAASVPKVTAPSLE
jgi:hypothetical protein